MNVIPLLDESLQLEIFYEGSDCDLDDNICVRITESCLEEEKIFVHDESNLYLTADQANAIIAALQKAVEKSTSHKK